MSWLSSLFGKVKENIGVVGKVVAAGAMAIPGANVIGALVTGVANVVGGAAGAANAAAQRGNEALGALGPLADQMAREQAQTTVQNDVPTLPPGQLSGLVKALGFAAVAAVAVKLLKTPQRKQSYGRRRY